MRGVAFLLPRSRSIEFDRLVALPRPHIVVRHIIDGELVRGLPLRGVGGIDARVPRLIADRARMYVQLEIAERKRAPSFSRSTVLAEFGFWGESARKPSEPATAAAKSGLTPFDAA